MKPRIEMLSEKQIVGNKISMSFADNKTYKLWSGFMPRRKEITNSVNALLFSVEVYDPTYFNEFDPTKEFEKWAAVEVSDTSDIPEGMETLTLPAGKYAVFIHKGPASEGPRTYQYIFQTWLPNSEYLLDDRPHFALMGEKYKNEDPSSEEEIWVPIREKV
ncbi:GyrI-like domain-containing protein [Limibacter armeniacum]|uniref:GyrI-like domain-containing protein n=1 Tax=Limibacter armeniacum TaxID=466084 RepID=UPI002FE54E9A